MPGLCGVGGRAACALPGLGPKTWGKVGFPHPQGAGRDPAALLPAPIAGSNPPHPVTGVVQSLAQAPCHSAKRLEPRAGVRCSGDAEGSVLAGLALLPGRSGLPMGLDCPLPAPGIPGRCRSFIGGCWPRPLSCGGPGGFLSPLSTLRACLHGDGLCRYLGFAVIGSSPPNLGENQPLPTSRRQRGQPAALLHSLPALGRGVPLPHRLLGVHRSPPIPHVPLDSAKLSPSRHRILAATPGRDQPRTLCCWTYTNLPVHRPWGSGLGGGPLCPGSLPGAVQAGGQAGSAPGLQHFRVFKTWWL